MPERGDSPKSRLLRSEKRKDLLNVTVDEKSVKITELKECDKFRLVGQSKIYEFDSYNDFCGLVLALYFDPDGSGYDWEEEVFDEDTLVIRVEGDTK